MRKSIPILLIPVGLLAACGSPQPTTTSDIGSMRFFSQKEAKEILNPVVRQRTSPTGDDPAFNYLREQDEKQRIPERCGKSPDEAMSAAAIPAALIGWGIGQLIQWTLTGISDELKSEIKRYSTNSPISSEPDDFYKNLSGNGKNPSVTCFRVSRVGKLSQENKTDDRNVADTLLLDYIGIASYDPAQPEIIMIRPIRLFVQRTTVKTFRRNGCAKP
ncbi:hypothetical protein [Cupriavidus oxalaticus]|uniref:hypothetical protein n=1 Tax=Cupriavidus oxalaticus TaxID=96344 RepID=UPI00316E21F6